MRLIDADALIKSINECIEAKDANYEWEQVQGLECALECIDEEPSAQPEITLESAIDYLHKIGWMQEHDRVLTESAQPEPQWIPCKERFPEPEEDVLVKIDGYGCYIWNRTFNHGDNYFWEDESGFYHEKYEVIAWMPLPTYEEVNE